MADKGNTSSEQAPLTLKAGTIIHVNGVPCTLSQDAPVTTNRSNLSQIGDDFRASDR
jgi:hypothetical protein